MIPNNEDFLIYEDYEKGLTHEDLADKYNTSVKSIHRAIQRVIGGNHSV